MGPSVAAVIVAAGRGFRAGGNLPKQYRELAGEPVIRSSLSLFAWHAQRGKARRDVGRPFKVIFDRPRYLIID